MTNDEGVPSSPEVSLVLETDRLLLRPFREDDLPAFVAYRSDPEVARYQSWSAPYSMERAREFLAAMEQTAPGAPGEWFQLAVELRAKGEMIGDCAFCLDEAAPGHAEIGFTLARAYQGQGYAREAVGRLLDYLFEGLGVRKVFANCDTRNERSARLLLRLGLAQTGVERKVPFKGEWCVERWYSISRGD